MDPTLLFLGLIPLLALTELFLGNDGVAAVADEDDPADDALEAATPEPGGGITQLLDRAEGEWDSGGAHETEDADQTLPPEPDPSDTESETAPETATETDGVDEAVIAGEEGPLVEDPGADYILDQSELPATLTDFEPGSDTVTLHLDDPPADIAEAVLDGGGCALLLDGTPALSFPALDLLPIGDIVITIGDSEEIFDLTELPAVGADVAADTGAETSGDGTGTSDVGDAGNVETGDVFEIDTGATGIGAQDRIITDFDPAAGDTLRITLPADYSGAMTLTMSNETHDGPHCHVYVDGKQVALVKNAASLTREMVQLVRADA